MCVPSDVGFFEYRLHAKVKRTGFVPCAYIYIYIHVYIYMIFM